jgi:hypothetical protein
MKDEERFASTTIVEPAEHSSFILHPSSFRPGSAVAPVQRMANDKTNNEPQSYGSDADWVTGQTGQKVNDPKAAPPNSQHGDFYESRRDAEHSGEHQGGKVSGVDADVATAAPAVEAGDQPQKKVSGEEGGARRDSFFKDRDYPGEP